MNKFENVDIFASLDAIMRQNTGFFQSDFDIDKEIIAKAAASPNREDKSYNRAFSRAWYHYTPIKFFCKCRYFHIVRLLDYSVCSIVCSMRKAVP